MMSSAHSSLECTTELCGRQQLDSESAVGATGIEPAVDLDDE